jgi:phage terminase Nu1 subunit (DNA packaging protein)
MARLVTKFEFASIAGVSPAAITKAVKKQLIAAMVGPRVDLDHPDTQSYLAEGERRSLRSNARLFAPTPEPTAVRPSTKPPELAQAPAPVRAAERPAAPAPAPARPAAAPRPPASSVDPGDDPTDVDHYLDMTLREILRKHGTLTTFRDLLAARKQMSDIEEKNLKNAERTGRLIPREFVRVHLLSHVATAYRRLLQDTAPTLARRMYAMCRAGTPVEEAEQLARDLMGGQLKQAKDQIKRVLGGHVDEEADAA